MNIERLARSGRSTNSSIPFKMIGRLVKRPIILNGIEEFVDRPDLANRSIFIPLQHVPNHRPEEEMRNDFNRARPRILGALLDGVAHGLQTLPDVSLNHYPRM